MLRSAVVFLLSLTLILSLFGGTTLAAGNRAGVVIAEQRLAGQYRLVLQVGPAQKMALRGKVGSGEKMIGGQMAACQMGKGANGQAMEAGACNHHLELHVYNRATGKVVRGAVVSITMTDTRMHTTIRVPVMELQHASMGSRDYHYGNNIYVTPGHYKVHVQVNKTRITFTLDLS